MLTLSFINQCDDRVFVDTLGEIFEKSPWVAEQACASRPFASVSELHAVMCKCVMNSEHTAQKALLNAHPELAGKAAQAGVLTLASTQEQKGAGLVDLTEDELARITTLNETYTAQFGFPFIIAVKQHTKSSIFAEFEHRLTNTAAQEQRTALEQVGLIAQFRLTSLFGTFA